MSLKDNFSQAVKEILNKNVKEDGSENQEQKTDLDRYLERSASQTQTQQQSAQPQQQAQQTEPQNTYSSARQEESHSSMQESASSTYTAPQAAAPEQSPYTDVEESTIISRNTIIEGNVRSFANVTVEGSVKGDIQSTKNASLSGKLIGNLQCNNASMAGSQMQGDITSKGQVKFDRDSLILGNITSSFLDMNGKVKGNIAISGKADFKSDAYILGDITVSTLTVSEGATINGKVNTTFLEDSPSSVFPEMIAMSEIG